MKGARNMTKKAKDAVKKALRSLVRAGSRSKLAPFPIDAWTDPAYEKWFEAHKASEEELDQQRATTFENAPLFSIVVPLFNTPLEYLETMVESVLAQSYENFELLLVNASPKQRKLQKAVRAYVDKDERIREIRLSENLGIALNTNAGIDEAKGDYVCFLDHDDMIEPNALFEYARVIDESTPDVLYCDEDIMEVRKGKKKLMNPLFKPDFSPEYLICKNYIVHWLCVSKAVIESMGRPGSEFDGAQDYNTVLFATNKAGNAAHISKVLYHWRASSGSTAKDADAKPFGKRAYRLSIDQELSRSWDGARIISSGIENIHNVWFTGLNENPKVSLCVSFSASEQIEEFLQFLNETNSYDNLELVFVGSDFERAQLDADDVKLVDVKKKASMFERMNAAAHEAKGDYLLFMSADSHFLTAEPLEQMIGLATHEGIGVVAPKTLYSDNSNKCFGIGVTSQTIMPLYRGYPDDFPGYQCNLRAFQDVSAASVEGMMIGRDLFERLGGFDENFASELGSADLCAAVRGEGLRIVQTDTVKVKTGAQAPTDRFNMNANSPDFDEGELPRFDEKHPGFRKAGDPYLNANLNQRSGYFQIDHDALGA